MATVRQCVFNNLHGMMCEKIVPTMYTEESRYIIKKVRYKINTMQHISQNQYKNQHTNTEIFCPITHMVYTLTLLTHETGIIGVIWNSDYPWIII